MEPSTTSHGKSKYRGKKGKSEKGKSDKVKAPRPPREPPKKTFKIIVRKLPIENFGLEKFQECLDRLCTALSIGNGIVVVDHFIEGKLSRKRGPITSTGFLCINEEETARAILANCPHTVPFIEDDPAQPELSLAPYQRSCKIKEKAIKSIGTYESDPEYIAFLARLEAPVPKKPSAETILDSKETGVNAGAGKSVPEESALLKFLQSRPEKKILDKRGLSRVLKGSSSSSKSEKLAREKQAAKEAAKEKRKEKRALEREQARAQKTLAKTIVAPKAILSRDSSAGLSGSSLLSSASLASNPSNISSSGEGSTGAPYEGKQPRRSKSGKGERAGAHVGGVTQIPEIKSALEESLRAFRENATSSSKSDSVSSKAVTQGVASMSIEDNRGIPSENLVQDGAVVSGRQASAKSSKSQKGSAKADGDKREKKERVKDAAERTLHRDKSSSGRQSSIDNDQIVQPARNQEPRVAVDDDEAGGPAHNSKRSGPEKSRKTNKDKPEKATHQVEDHPKKIASRFGDGSAPPKILIKPRPTENVARTPIVQTSEEFETKSGIIATSYGLEGSLPTRGSNTGFSASGSNVGYKTEYRPGHRSASGQADYAPMSAGPIPQDQHAFYDRDYDAYQGHPSTAAASRYGQYPSPASLPQQPVGQTPYQYGSRRTGHDRGMYQSDQDAYPVESQYYAGSSGQQYPNYSSPYYAPPQHQQAMYPQRAATQLKVTPRDPNRFPPPPGP